MGDTIGKGGRIGDRESDSYVGRRDSQEGRQARDREADSYRGRRDSREGRQDGRQRGKKTTKPGNHRLARKTLFSVLVFKFN